MGKRFFYGNKEYELPDGYEYVNLDDEKFRKALAICFDGDYPIVTIAGPGGCGKSVIYRILYDALPNTLAMASTGVAAFNIAQHGIPCMTIHSALKLSPLPLYDWNKPDKSCVIYLSHYEYMLIDEISMVDCNLLDYILMHVKYANEYRDDGKMLHVILFGDVLQLPPVSKIAGSVAVNEKERELKKCWRERYGNAEVGYWFFSPNFRATKRITVELETGYRQSDSSFKEMLRVIRYADKDNLERILAEINKRKVDEAEHRAKYDSENNHMLFLTGRNKDVVAYNNLHIQSFIDSKVECHEYKSSVIGPMTDDAFYRHYNPEDPAARKNLFHDFFPILEDTQTLYLGEQVMCICNDRTSGFQNGTVGRIVRFIRKEPKGMYYPVVKTYDERQPFTVGYHTFEYFAAYVKDDGEIAYNKIFEVESLACKCAYAVTFHKSQGLTLDSVYIDTRHKGGDGGEESFIPDSGIYMGLSRCRTLSGIGLSDTIMPEQIRVNEYTSLFFRPDRDEIKLPSDDSITDFDRAASAMNIIRRRKSRIRLSDLLGDE